MKVLLGCCLFFFSFLSLTDCDAQVIGEPIHIPLLQGHKTIDSLIERVLKDESLNAKPDTATTRNDFLFLEIFRWKGDENYSFQITRNKKSAINYRINQIEHGKQRYGVFHYKGNTIFVWTNDSFADFFIPTSFSNTFDFILYSNNIQVTPDELHPRPMHYKLENGSISPEGPPPVQQVIK